MINLAAFAMLRGRRGGVLNDQKEKSEMKNCPR